MRGVISPPAVQGDATSSMPLLDNSIRWGKTGCWTSCRIRCRTARSFWTTHINSFRLSDYYSGFAGGCRRVVTIRSKSRRRTTITSAPIRRVVALSIELGNSQRCPSPFLVRIHFLSSDYMTVTQAISVICERPGSPAGKCWLNLLLKFFRNFIKRDLAVISKSSRWI